MRQPLFVIATLYLLLLLNAHSAELGPVKVFILAGQSNMEGQGVADLDGPDYNSGHGTLVTLLRDEKKASLFQHLRKDEGEWVVRKDVWVSYQREREPLLRGPLTMGFSVYGDSHHFGPELQFGFVVGDYFTNQVLLIKTAWGGKSLYKDFRPPSAGGPVGPYYSKMLEEVRSALTRLPIEFPQYDNRGYELTGLVWYQGWNDGTDGPVAVAQYETNLIHLVADLRKDLNTPNLPVVIGELTGPWVQAPDEWEKLRKAQSSAAARISNAIFVATHEFVRRPEDSPNPTHGHHEFGNAETYFLVGDALGKGMVQLLQSVNSSDSSTSTPTRPGTDSKPAVSPITEHGDGLHGYIGFSHDSPPKDAGFNAGMGFYAAVWPLISEPLANFQIGLPSSWILPDNSDNKDRPLAPEGTLARTWKERGPTWDSVFQTVEGGLGYWAGNHFRYGPPKFSMNATLFFTSTTTPVTVWK